MTSLSVDVWRVGQTLTNPPPDGAPKDKTYRKYAAGVDRALALFDTAVEEWADYISFLNRLLRVWERGPEIQENGAGD